MVAVMAGYAATTDGADADTTDMEWYEKGVALVQGWMRDNFPVVYCDTAYTCRHCNVVIRALLTRDRRIRVRTSVSGDSVPMSCGTMIRFVAPPQPE